MSSEHDATRASQRPLGPWLLALVVAVALTAVGFVAWRQWGQPAALTAAQQAEAEAKKKAEQEKQREIDPQVERLVMLPGDPTAENQPLKPGHWVAASARMRALYQDFVGTQATTVIDRRGDPLPVDGTPVVLESTRPVTLAKGLPKEIATTFLAPPREKSLRVQTSLVERGFGRSLRSQTAVAEMPAYQYFLVVLAKEPVRYSLLKTLDAVSVPWDGEQESDDSADPLHYRVAMAPLGRTIPLPDNALTWTSIAYVLWDEVDPRLFTPDEREALIDWLHWGGQLVVSGPDSLDLLKGSFLEPYLPAVSGGSRAIAAADVAALNDHWQIRTAHAGRPLAPRAPWSGVALESRLRPDERDALGATTGGLLVERAVGRGRVVVSAMRLSERELVNWQGGFQSLFNGGILRRPRREYRPGYYGELTLAWADPTLATRRLDARLTTGLRFLTRDWGVETNYRAVDVAPDGTESIAQPGQPAAADSLSVREWRPPAQVGGVGAWNNFSAAANVAREALVEAAGVEVPDTSFVVLALALYLVALVPLNWLVFHAIGKVEWAWAAAPVIALLGTWAIVDRARLDIGFVRAQTEIGVLEIQPQYPRGHLSRFTALYTSLSSTYELAFDNLTTLAAPFPSQPRGASGEEPATSATATFERFDTVRLGNVFVPSNTTNMVHSEQMFALDGAIQLGMSRSQGRLQIENRSQFLLSSVALVERTSRKDEAAGKAPALRGMWIGTLRPGESLPAVFSLPVAVEKDKPPFAAERAAEAALVRTPRLSIEPLFALALDVANFEPGERRLVARIDEVLPGEQVSPAASQVRGAVLVAAHLAYGPRPEPQPDVNTSRDVTRHTDQSLELEDDGSG